jgi:hypothetical protein
VTLPEGLFELTVEGSGGYELCVPKRSLTMHPIEKTAFADPVTGRTVHRLTARGINVSLYFNNHAWTPEGDGVFFLRV